ncbi:MAG: hypothetical protein WDN45_00930 [Caulobacteraceae bacterium]
MAAGALAFLALILAVGLALFAIGRLRIELSGHHLAPVLRHALAARAGTSLLAIGVALAWAGAAGRWLRPESLAFGALMILAIGAVVLQALAPLDAFILTWPFVLIGLALVLYRARRPAAWIVLMAAQAQVLYWAHLYFDLVGQVTPLAVTPFAALSMAVLLPVCPPAGRRVAWTGLAAGRNRGRPVPARAARLTGPPPIDPAPSIWPALTSRRS